jgi:hypothetical protein
MLKTAKIALFVAALPGIAVAAYVTLQSADPDTRQYCLANPEMRRNVRVLETWGGSARTPRVPNDFNGDGEPDRFWLEYSRMEPLFGDSTWGMLHVCSSKDGGELLVYPTAMILDSVSWAGDIDGNGMDDRRVANDARTFNLLYTR